MTEPTGDDIFVNPRHMHEISAEVWEALTKANNPPFLFQRGHMLQDIMYGDDGRPMLRCLDKAAFKGVIDRNANFLRKTIDANVPTRPPDYVVADMMAFKEFPLPILLGIANAPMFTSQGVLNITPGYQSDTHYYLDLKDGMSIPEVPDKPDKAAVSKAKSLLLDELLIDFPFATESDLTNTVSAMMLGFVRPMIKGPTPLHLIESPTPGTGKGLLVDMITMPAAGQGPNVMTEGRDEDEMRKRITAKLLQAPSAVLIDNVRYRLDSAALSAALTSDVWEDRVLGYSHTAAIPVTCTWLATANNPHLSVELARRTVSIRLDAVEEKPWKREGFRHKHLRRWALENRGELIWALLTLVQAWIASGKPLGKEPLGSYEAYAEVMGGILEVADISGFLGTQDRGYEEAEQELGPWAEFCEIWWQDCRDKEVKTDYLFNLVSHHKLFQDLWGGKDEHAARTAFGKAMANMRDRVIGRLRIRRTGTDSRTKALVYRLELIGEDQSAGLAGVRGGHSDGEKLNINNNLPG